MGVLTADMRRVIEEQQLSFAATVSPDGWPNLSPKGSTRVYDDDHLIFVDITSPTTVANLLANPRIEINVVDPIVRRGYRFRGRAEVFERGEAFERLLAFMRAAGSTTAVNSLVLVNVERALPVWSPAYDQGRTEAEVVALWEAKYEALKARRRT